MTERARTSRGRRPGAPDTRTEILESARALFAARGVANTSMRAVASGAGVDPSLVHHYFDSKDDLFMAALELPVDPRELLAPVVRDGPDRAGEALLRTLIGVWEDPGNRLTMLGLLRSVVQPSGEHLLVEGFVPVVLEPVGQALGLDRPELRMPLVASQVMGLLLSRYLLRLEPIASMEVDQLVATYAPTLQHYLTGDLPS